MIACWLKPSVWDGWLIDGVHNSFTEDFFILLNFISQMKVSLKGIDDVYARNSTNHFSNQILHSLAINKGLIQPNELFQGST